MRAGACVKELEATGSAPVRCGEGLMRRAQFDSTGCTAKPGCGTGGAAERCRRLASSALGGCSAHHQHFDGHGLCAVAQRLVDLRSKAGTGTTGLRG